MSHFKAPPKKNLGQHFLADRTSIDQIVMAVNPKPGDRLVEREQGVVHLVGALDAYASHFDHPGWKALETGH